MPITNRGKTNYLVTEDVRQWLDSLPRAKRIVPDGTSLRDKHGQFRSRFSSAPGHD